MNSWPPPLLKGCHSFLRVRNDDFDPIPSLRFARCHLFPVFFKEVVPNLGYVRLSWGIYIDTDYLLILIPLRVTITWFTFIQNFPSIQILLLSQLSNRTWPHHIYWIRSTCYFSSRLFVLKIIRNQNQEVEIKD